MDLPRGTFPIGPQQGILRISTRREGAGARLGHDLVIEATRWEGTVEISEGPDGRVEVTVDGRSLEVREGHGGARALSDGDRSEIRSNIEGKVLHTDRYPTIHFRSDQVQGLSSDGERVQATLIGNLEMVGRSAPASVQVTLEPGQNGVHVRAQARIRQTDWGIKPYTAFLGALKVADEVTIEADLTLPGGG